MYTIEQKHGAWVILDHAGRQHRLGYRTRAKAYVSQQRMIAGLIRFESIN